MPTIGATHPTILDWAKSLDPDGKTADVVELLAQSNQMLEDMVWTEGNLPTGHRVTVRTGLPTPTWRILNKGVAASKATTAQIDEQCAMLEARAQVDKKLADLNGNTAKFRLQQSLAHVEAMSQEVQQTLLYGTSINPEEFVGFAARYSAISGAANGQNVLSAGGSGSDNASVWLIGWAEDTVCGIFPKGSKAGINHQDLGEADAFDASNNRFRAYMDRWAWDCGLALMDWRYAVRLANIDISDLIALTGTQASTAATELIRMMSRMIDRIPSPGRVKLAFYAGRTVCSHLRIQALQKSSSALGVQEALNQFGDKIQDLRFLGIPVRLCDQLLETEAAVS